MKLFPLNSDKIILHWYLLKSNPNGLHQVVETYRSSQPHSSWKWGFKCQNVIRSEGWYFDSKKRGWMM